MLCLSHSPVVPPGLSSHKCGTAWSTNCHLTWSTSCCLAPSPLHPSCPSPPLLPVWMNVSSSIPWLPDFHIVRFSVSTGCFLFLNLSFSFFWLCGRQRVSIYASILFRSPKNQVFWRILLFFHLGPVSLSSHFGYSFAFSALDVKLISC